MLNPTVLKRPQSFYASYLTADIGPTDVNIPVATVPTETSGYLVIQENTDREEIILYAGFTGNTLTGCVRGLPEVGATESGGTGIAHGANSRIAMNVAHLYVSMLQKAFNDHQGDLAHSYRGFVALQSDLASIPMPTLGDTAFVTSVQAYFWYNGTAWTAVPVGASGGLSGAGAGNGKPMSFALPGTSYWTGALQFFADQEATAYVLVRGGAHVLCMQRVGGTIWSRDYTADWVSASGALSAVLLGTLMYVLLTDGTGFRVYRYDATDATVAGTLMTTSGGSLGTSGMLMTSDGTRLVFTNQAGNSASDNILSKYSIAGTVLTFVSNTTMAGGSTCFTNGLAADSRGSFYGFDYTNQKARSWDQSGTPTYTSSVMIMQPAFRIHQWGNTVYLTNGQDTSPGIGPILFVKLYIPGTDLLPDGLVDSVQPLSADGAVTVESLSASSSSVAAVGLLTLPFGISASSLTLRSNNAANASGTVKVALYRRDGQSKLLEITVTTPNNANASVTSALPSALALPAGDYYVVSVPQGSTVADLQVWAKSSGPNLFNQVAGKPVFQGTIAVTAGNMPVSFSPSSDITPTSSGRGLCIRLDS